MKIKDILGSRSGEFQTLDIDGTVAQALQIMSAFSVSAVVVMDGSKPEGIFTERDLVRFHILCPQKNTNDVHLKDVMTSMMVVAEPEDTVEDAMAMMTQAKTRHLPVVGGHKIVGLIALEDLVKAHVGALTQELHYLKDYISDLQDAAHD